MPVDHGRQQKSDNDQAEDGQQNEIALEFLGDADGRRGAVGHRCFWHGAGWGSNGIQYGSVDMHVMVARDLMRVGMRVYQRREALQQRDQCHHEEFDPGENHGASLDQV